MKNRILKWIRRESESKLPLLDIFAASGLLTVFVTRAYLALMNYPQIGGEKLHIAHMLWGGLLLAVVVMYLALMNKPDKKAAMFFGGIGFGLFIDELGKFITVDNDYFFKPAASLIIVIFIFLWVGLRIVIARHEHKAVLPPAEWPTRRIERIYVYTWLVLQTITVVVLAFVNLLIGDDAWGSDVFAVLSVFEILYGLALIAIWVLILRRKRELAAMLIRAVAAIGILILSPINFYISQFGAATGFIVLVVLIIATSREYRKT